jgi:hypothetical protein
MNIVVVHDKKGRISSLAVPTPDGEGELRVVPGPDDRVSELDTELDLSGDEHEVAKRLADVARNHTIDLSAAAPRLRPRK